MSPLAPSESVDDFLTWLGQPTNVLPPGHGHAHDHGHHGHHTHGHAHGHGANNVPFTHQKSKVSDSEYAARLRELAKSPLEEMAKPLLVGPAIVPTRAPSEEKSRSGNGREAKKEKKRRSDGENANGDTAKAKNNTQAK